MRPVKVGKRWNGRWTYLCRACSSVCRVDWASQPEAFRRAVMHAAMCQHIREANRDR